MSEIMDNGQLTMENGKLKIERENNNSQLSTFNYQLPKGWEIKKLGEVCKLINGRAYSKKELLNNGKYRVLRVGNFFTNNNWYYSNLELPNEKYCTNGDLLYAWSASFGPRIWKEEKVIFHYHIWKVDFDENIIDKMFLYNWFNWDVEQIKKEQGAGTTMVHVSMKSMNARVIPIPPLPEQKRIVAILDRAFSAIERSRNIAEQNLQNAKELFESYLNRIFEEKGEGWEEKRLGEVCEIKNGGTPKTGIKEYWDGEVNWITPKDLGKLANRYVFETPRKITSLGLQKSSAKLLPINSIILSTRAPIGHLAINKTEMATNQGCRGIIPSDNILTEFVYYFLSKSVKKLNELGTGATFKELSSRALYDFIIPFPPLQKQKRIVAELDTLQAKTKKLEAIYQKKIDNLEELKKTILQKAFRGELTEKEISV